MDNEIVIEFMNKCKISSDTNFITRGLHLINLLQNAGLYKNVALCEADGDGICLQWFPPDEGEIYCYIFYPESKEIQEKPFYIGVMNVPPKEIGIEESYHLQTAEETFAILSLILKKRLF